MDEPKVNVKCMECGKKFQTIVDTTPCPQCGGGDIELTISIRARCGKVGA
jgi:DNA polymerase II large subunit